MIIAKLSLGPCVTNEASRPEQFRVTGGWLGEAEGEKEKSVTQFLCHGHGVASRVTSIPLPPACFTLAMAAPTPATDAPVKEPIAPKHVLYCAGQ